MDPFFYVFQAIIPNRIFQNNSIMISILRCFLSIIPLFEFFQVVSLLLAGGNCAVDFFLTFIGAQKQGNLSVLMALRIHDMAHIVLASGQTIFDIAITELLGLTMVTGIITWYLTITAYDLIPMAIYWVVPFIAVSIVGVVQVLLVPLTEVKEASSVAIEKMKISLENIANFCTGKEFSLRKFWRMRMTAMRPPTLYAGMFDHRFLQLDRSTKVSFIENMVSFIISALLAKRN